MVADADKARRWIVAGVEDEGGVVTFKDLARSLDLPLPESRRALADAAKELTGVEALWWLSGQTDKGERYVGLVPDGKLAAAREKLASVSSLSVYSLQRGPVTDVAGHLPSRETAREEAKLPRPIRCAVPEWSGPKVPQPKAEPKGANGSHGAAGNGSNGASKPSSCAAAAPSNGSSGASAAGIFGARSAPGSKASGAKKAGSIADAFMKVKPKAKVEEGSEDKTSEAKTSSVKSSKASPSPSKHDPRRPMKTTTLMPKYQPTTTPTKRTPTPTEEDDDSPIKAQPKRKRRTYIDDSDEEEQEEEKEVEEGKKAAEVSQPKTPPQLSKSHADIFSDGGDSSPEKASPRRSPRRASPDKSPAKAPAKAKAAKAKPKKAEAKTSQPKAKGKKSKKAVEEEEPMEEEEEEAPSPSPPPKKPRVGAPAAPGLVKSRAEEVKTWEDDDGFLITSATKVTKVTKAASPAKRASPAKTSSASLPSRSSPRKGSSKATTKAKAASTATAGKKQADITSFFAKK